MGRVRVVRVAEFMAEEANGGFVFGGWCGAEEGELGERIDVHEVVGLFLSVVHQEKITYNIRKFINQLT